MAFLGTLLHQVILNLGKLNYLDDGEHDWINWPKFWVKFL